MKGAVWGIIPASGMGKFTEFSTGPVGSDEQAEKRAIGLVLIPKQKERKSREGKIFQVQGRFYRGRTADYTHSVRHLADPEIVSNVEKFGT